MTALLPEQIDALRDVQEICQQMGVDIVVIGAIAWRIWLVDDNRQTEDVDVVVALDVDELPRLTERLIHRGWSRDSHKEQRWHSPKKARVDLLPVGPTARREKYVFWPKAETRMSVVGFDHVFQDAVERNLGRNLTIRVVPLVVLALTKIVSYLDDPVRRHKDLEDLLVLMHKYEDGDRRFSDEILAAGVEYDEAGAYLLGRDLRELFSTDDELQTIEQFMARIGSADFQIPPTLARLAAFSEEDDRSRFPRILTAFERGFRRSR